MRVGTSWAAFWAKLGEPLGPQRASGNKTVAPPGNWALRRVTKVFPQLLLSRANTSITKGPFSLSTQESAPLGVFSPKKGASSTKKRLGGTPLWTPLQKDSLAAGPSFSMKGANNFSPSNIFHTTARGPPRGGPSPLLWKTPSRTKLWPLFLHPGPPVGVPLPDKEDPSTSSDWRSSQQFLCWGGGSFYLSGGQTSALFLRSRPLLFSGEKKTPPPRGFS